MPSLPPGSYQITVSGTGFQEKVIRDLTLEVAGKSSLNIDLAVGNEQQSVTVDAGGVQMETTDASVSTVVDQKFVENIPLNGRSFQSLLTAVPGVTVVPSSNGQGYSGELSVNGMRTESNYYMVDGVSMNTGVAASTPGWGGGYAGATPAQTVLGTTQSLISIEALKELRATTSTYPAEYGRTPGGRVLLQQPLWKQRLARLCLRILPQRCSGFQRFLQPSRWSSQAAYEAERLWRNTWRSGDHSGVVQRP